MLTSVLMYFALVCAVGAWLFLPPFRANVRLGVVWVLQKLHLTAQARGAEAKDRVAGYAMQIQQSASKTVLNGFERLHRHRLVLGCGVALIAMPTLAVWWFGSSRTLEAFNDASTDTPGVVQALLQGEQLSPPAPLPPEAFTTAEVQSVRPELVFADRRWAKLDAHFEQRLLLVYQIMREEHGFEMVLVEGYRSPERQNELAQMGANVTRAGAWQSYHQYGLAADSAFMRGGKIVISERDPWAMRGYELYGQVAKRVGLTWGGHWQNADLGHVEFRKSGAAQTPIMNPKFEPPRGLTPRD
jgi:peptidoglycan LD-endopeptidase CwlK